MDDTFPCCQIGILMSLIFSIGATAVLSDLWSKEWMTLLLSFQVTLLFLLLPSAFTCSQWGFHPWHLLCFVSWPGDGTLFTCGRSLPGNGAGLANSVAFLSHEQQRWGAFDLNMTGWMMLDHFRKIFDFFRRLTPLMSIHPFPSTNLGLGCGGSRFSQALQTSLSPTTCSSSWGDPEAFLGQMRYIVPMSQTF